MWESLGHRKALIHVTKLFWKLVMLHLERTKDNEVIVLKDAKGLLIKVGLDSFHPTSEGRTK